MVPQLEEWAASGGFAWSASLVAERSEAALVAKQEGKLMNDVTRKTLQSLKIVADNAREARDKQGNVDDLKVALDRIADRLDDIIRRAL